MTGTPPAWVADHLDAVPATHLPAGALQVIELYGTNPTRAQVEEVARQLNHLVRVSEVAAGAAVHRLPGLSGSVRDDAALRARHRATVRPTPHVLPAARRVVCTRPAHSEENRYRRCGSYDTRKSLRGLEE